MIQERDIPVLYALARYFVMNRRMIQRHYPTDRDGRLTRRRLGALHRDGFIGKQRLLVVNPRDEAPAPVYHLAKRGCQFLAEHAGDDRYLWKPTTVGKPMHLHHYLAVADTQMLFDAAVAHSPVKLVQWCNEEEVLNPDHPNPKEHIKLFTELRKQPRLVCVPDAGFLLDIDGHRGVFYLERDRDRDNYSHRRVAALKAPGYAELHHRGGHRRHFPATTLNRFIVLLIAPHQRRRDALRRAFVGKDGVQLWRFASREDLTPASLLHEPVWFRADGVEPEPLVRLNRPHPPESEEEPCQD